METLANNILDQMTGVAKPQKKFLVTLFLTILLMRGKANFRNMSRYSALNEKRYSRQYRTPFDFVDFNKRLIAENVPSHHEKIGAMDCSFISKSGKETYGLGFFYDSCHNKATKGLEISNLAVIDISHNTGYRLSSWQTPPQAEIEKLVTEHASAPGNQQPTEEEAEITRMDFYAHHLRRDAAYLPTEVKYLAVDGYYTKVKFIQAVADVGLYVVGKLRHDANLRYLYDGPQKQLGARRKYEGQLSFDDLSRFAYRGEVDKDIHLYTIGVNRVSLKCHIRLVYGLNLRNKNKPGYARLFSTDTDLDAETIYRYDQARFQIEFIFRDAKPFTGLNDCQARRQACLDFHFNASLTTLNLAKVEAYASFDYDLETPFSLLTQTMVYFNDHFLQKVFSILDLDLTLINGNPEFEALRNYGAIAPAGYG